MRKRFVIGLTLLGALSLGTGLVVLLLLRHEPEFYRVAAVAAGESRQQASKRLLAQMVQLANDVKQLPRWETTVAAEDANAWLAEEFPRLAQTQAQELVDWLGELRVAFDDGKLLVGVRGNRFGLACVIWIRAEIWVPKPGTLAVRLRHVGLGALPGPTERLKDLIDTAARQNEFAIQWKQLDGDPVALLEFSGRSSLASIEKLDIGRGTTHAAGVRRPRANAVGRRARERKP